MIYTWEESDFNTNSNKWGLMASRDDEIVIIGGKGVTSLQDGHSWVYTDYAAMVKDFNDAKYIPVLAPR